VGPFRRHVNGIRRALSERADDPALLLQLPLRMRRGVRPVWARAPHWHRFDNVIVWQPRHPISAVSRGDGTAVAPEMPADAKKGSISID